MNRILWGLAALPLLVCAYACSDDEETPVTNPGTDAGTQADTSTPTPTSDAATEDANVTPVAVELKFQARVGAAPFACGASFDGIGTTSASAVGADFRFFIHDVKLLKGTTEVPVTLDTIDPWQSARIALLDFEDKTGECEGTTGMNDVVKGKVPPGTYDGISFTVGVPEDLNHLAKETQPAPLPGSGMNWSWTSGYIHFAAQLNATTEDAGARVPKFFAHIGSSQCSGDPADGGTPGCGRKNRPVVKLTGFDPATKKIVVDAKTLLSTSNIDQNGGGIPGCMSGLTDPDCPAVFTQLGLDFDSGAPTGSAPVFTVEAR